MPYYPPAASSSSSGILIQEADGNPTGTATALIFPNTTLGISSGTATYTPAAAGGGGSVVFYDEGNAAGTAAIINVVGGGGTVAVSSGTAVITIAESAGSSPFYLDTVTLHGTAGDDFDGTSLNARWTATGAFDAQATRFAEAGSWMAMACRSTTAESVYQTGPVKETFEVITKHSNEGATGHMVGPAIVSTTGTGVACALRSEVSTFVIVNIASYAYTSDGTSVSIGGGNAVMDYMRGSPIWLSLRKIPTALDGDIYMARFSLNGNTWSRTLHYDPSSFTYAKMGFGRLSGGATNDQIAIDRFNVVDAYDVGNNLCATPVGGGSVTATASSNFSGFAPARAIDGTSNDWSADNGATDYAGAGLYLNINWSVSQEFNRVVMKERAGDVFGKAHLEITHASGTAIVPIDEHVGGSSKWHVKDFTTLTGVTDLRIVSDGSPGANCGFTEVEAYLRS